MLLTKLKETAESNRPIQYAFRGVDIPFNYNLANSAPELSEVPWC